MVLTKKDLQNDKTVQYNLERIAKNDNISYDSNGIYVKVHLNKEWIKFYEQLIDFFFYTLNITNMRMHNSSLRHSVVLLTRATDKLLDQPKYMYSSNKGFKGGMDNLLLNCISIEPQLLKSFHDKNNPYSKVVAKSSTPIYSKKLNTFTISFDTSPILIPSLLKNLIRLQKQYEGVYTIDELIFIVLYRYSLVFKFKQQDDSYHLKLSKKWVKKFKNN